MHFENSFNRLFNFRLIRPAISDWAIIRDRQDVLLNYYGPSRMTVSLGHSATVDITQKTDYPVSGSVDVEVSPSKTLPFMLKLRIPYWSRRTKVTLNGRHVEGVRPGHYLAINRRWRKGDRISIRLDMSVHYWAGEGDCRGLTSIYRGPLLLAFDHRYNPHLSPRTGRRVRDADLSKPFARGILRIPALDARALKCKPVRWCDWLPPLLLLDVAATNGKRVRLCDYGSAGAGGTPYVTWLPVRHAPRPVAFSPANPLRSERWKG